MLSIRPTTLPGWAAELRRPLWFACHLNAVPELGVGGYAWSLWVADHRPQAEHYAARKLRDGLCLAVAVCRVTRAGLIEFYGRKVCVSPDARPDASLLLPRSADLIWAVQTTTMLESDYQEMEDG